MFTNIIGNAISYTPAGGEVSIRWTEVDDLVHIEVRDTGRGIDADDIDRIFERFNRVDPASNWGTGVGLTIARSIARLHGGDVTAASEGEGRGSVFTVTLPRSDDQPPITGSSPTPN